MLLIFPFSMRESINYAIRARLRGERIVGAASEQFKYTEYCDECAILPTIYQEDFERQIKILIDGFGITRFYTPHEIVYQKVKSLDLKIEFAEASPHEIMNEEYRAAIKTGLHPALVIQCGRIYGHMNEEKLAGIEEISHECPIGPIIEVGCAWGKSLKAIDILFDSQIYAFDTWDRESGRQLSAEHPVNTSNDVIDWEVMEGVCRANVLSAIYNADISTIPDMVTLLHIDANHDYECVKMDWHTYGRKLVSGGWLILDDIDWPGVEKLWGEIKNGFDKTFIKGGAMFARKK